VESYQHYHLFRQDYPNQQEEMLYQYLPDDLLPQLMDLHYMVIVNQ
jgi:hypothetical protein